MTYDEEISTVSLAMEEPEDTAELQIERRADYVLRELDELMLLAANPETVDLVEGQRVIIGQILTRAQLIASFLMARKPRLTVVSNHVR